MMPLTVDPIALGLWVGLIAAAAKIFYDGQQRKTERITALSASDKSKAEATKANADSDVAQAAALATAATTAGDYIKLYADVVKEMGILTGRFGALEANVSNLMTQVEIITRDRDGFKSRLAECQETSRTLESERDEYKKGWQSAMFLLEGTAEGKVDPGLANVAAETIKTVLAYDKAQATRLSKGGDYTASPRPADNITQNITQNITPPEQQGQ